jgi:hypothetical protein
MTKRNRKAAPVAVPELAAAPLAAGAFEVHVRMYRALEAQRNYKGLLGDCFLIRIVEAGRQSNILIDCGMLLGSPNAKARMQMIACDIVSECGGDLAAGRAGTLDLLVVTHEHWDHISGFSQASDIFLDPARLKIANLWMAWTEDPENKTAQELRARFDKSGAAFSALAARLSRESQRFGADASARALSGLEGFLGATAAGGGTLAGRDIMDRLKALGDANVPNPTRVSFLTPGMVCKTPGDNGLRAFVLGPPTDTKLLFKDAPSTGDAQETYLDSPQFDGAQILKFSDGSDPDPLTDSPFAPPYCRILSKDLEGSVANGPASDAPAREWLRASYFGVPGTGTAADAANARRRIDTDWLGAAGPLALKLDSDTNNTSLVLAFDLPDGTAMLFAADAQVGNWLSWHRQDYVDENGISYTATELLGRTRFYKVGHHGSHNATLDAQGLALMTRPDLVAAIPTDEDLGKAQGRSGWQMPNPRVKAALNERTKGRIMRNDRIYALPARADDPELKNVEPAFFDKINEADLFLEYRVL